MTTNSLGLDSSWRGFLQEVADRVVVGGTAVQPALLLDMLRCPYNSAAAVAHP